MSRLKLYTGAGYDIISTDGKRLEKRAGIAYSAHRGASDIDNSIQGLIKAKMQGFEYCECDIQFTSDDVPIVCHNSTVGGYTIADETAETITSVELGRDIGFGIIYVPTFDDFVKCAKLIGMKLVVDVKTSTEAYLDEICRIVNSYGLQYETIYLCPDITAIGICIGASPGCHAHFCTTSGSSIPSDVSDYVALQSQSNHIGFNVNGTANSDLVQSNVRAYGLELSYWNVTASNYAALAATCPMFMTTDMTMTAIEAAEQDYLDSIELF